MLQNHVYTIMKLDSVVYPVDAVLIENITYFKQMRKSYQDHTKAL